MKTETFTLPTYWASYLINGVTDSLQGGEKEEIDKFVKDNGNPEFVDVSEETHFSSYNDANTMLGGDVAEFTAIYRELS